MAWFIRQAAHTLEITEICAFGVNFRYSRCVSSTRESASNSLRLDILQATATLTFVSQIESVGAQTKSCIL